METAAGIFCIVLLVCAGLYGAYHEIKYIKLLRIREQKQIEVYEILIRKLDKIICFEIHDD